MTQFVITRHWLANKLRNSVIVCQPGVSNGSHLCSRMVLRNRFVGRDINPGIFSQSTVVKSRLERRHEFLEFSTFDARTKTEKRLAQKYYKYVLPVVEFQINIYFANEFRPDRLHENVADGHAHIERPRNDQFDHCGDHWRRGLANTRLFLLLLLQPTTVLPLLLLSVIITTIVSRRTIAVRVTILYYFNKLCFYAHTVRRLHNSTPQRVCRVVCKIPRPELRSISPRARRPSRRSMQTGFLKFYFFYFFLRRTLVRLFRGASLRPTNSSFHPSGHP